ncbi:MAG: hypothetical protein K6U11_03445 [bacterium]|nr:hypothetical protein [bacterium]
MCLVCEGVSCPYPAVWAMIGIRLANELFIDPAGVGRVLVALTGPT